MPECSWYSICQLTSHFISLSPNFGKGCCCTLVQPYYLSLTLSLACPLLFPIWSPPLASSPSPSLHMPSSLSAAAPDDSPLRSAALATLPPCQLTPSLSFSHLTVSLCIHKTSNVVNILLCMCIPCLRAV